MKHLLVRANRVVLYYTLRGKGTTGKVAKAISKADTFYRKMRDSPDASTRNLRERALSCRILLVLFSSIGPASAYTY